MPIANEDVVVKREGFWEAAEEVMHFINALDSAGMDANAVRSAIYHKCLEMRPGAAPIERMREALVPFALAADDLDDKHGDSSEIWEAPASMSITAGHLRDARAALSGAQNNG